MDYLELRKAITPARLTAFDQAALSRGQPQEKSIELYEWNAEVSSALLLPLHFFEVVLRNAVHDAISLAYQEQWPWDGSFVSSVRSQVGRYRPRHDLQKNARSHSTTGKVIPEMKFAFWEQMFTSGYDQAIWKPHLTSVFPNLPITTDEPSAARSVRLDVEKVRKIRNRVAHHEPIFSQDVPAVIDAIHRVTAYRSPDVGVWVATKHRVTTVLAQRPTWYV